MCDNDKTVGPLEKKQCLGEQCAVCHQQQQHGYKPELSFYIYNPEGKSETRKTCQVRINLLKSKVLGLCKRERERGKKNPYLARMRREQRGRSNGPI